MPEESIWRGSPSQWKNAGHFLVLVFASLMIIGVVLASTHFLPQIFPYNHLLLLLLFLPLFNALRTYLRTRTMVYELTTERIKTSQGILSKLNETLELYRVKDIETRQPFALRLFGLEDIHLLTSDASSPLVIVSAVRSTAALADKIRNQVETIRTQKGVREIDME